MQVRATCHADVDRGHPRTGVAIRRCRRPTRPRRSRPRHRRSRERELLDRGGEFAPASRERRVIAGRRVRHARSNPRTSGCRSARPAFAPTGPCSENRIRFGLHGDYTRKCRRIIQCTSRSGSSRRPSGTRRESGPTGYRVCGRGSSSARTIASATTAGPGATSNERRITSSQADRGMRRCALAGSPWRH